MKRGIQIAVMAVMSMVLGAGLLPAQSWSDRGGDRGGWGHHDDRGSYQYRDDRGRDGYRDGYGDDYYRRDHHVGRSLAIIGGGAAAGAAIGGASGGGRGAGIGALIGGASGLVIDQAVRHHHRDHDRY